MSRARAYARCPPAPTRTWNLSGSGTATAFRRASIADTDAADAQWYKRSSDTHGWEWSRVLRETDNCLYVLGSPSMPTAGLFGVRGKHLSLEGVPTRRLDYFQVAPALRGTGFARQAFAAFARFALDAGASQLVVCSLANQKVLQFYKDIGGLVGPVPGWSVPPGLVPVWIAAGTLRELGALADALE